MEAVAVTLQQPIRQFVEHESQERNISIQEFIAELLELGFEKLLEERYQLYRHGEISFGRLAQEMGITSWELSYLLDERGWPAHNLPSVSAC